MRNQDEENLTQAYSDERLCMLVQNGDKQAEELLAVRYRSVVEAIAHSYFLEGAEDHDLSQEGMIGLIKAMRAFDRELGIPFEAFARLCVRREIFKAIKSASAEKHEPLNHSRTLFPYLESGKSDGLQPDSEPKLDPEQLLIGREEEQQHRRQLMERLSPLEKKILILQLEGCSYEEMAVAVGKSVKSVDNAIQRIRRKAAAVFSDEYR
jgi:RNA polymerase sporulation-specific sigma factor